MHTSLSTCCSIGQRLLNVFFDLGFLMPRLIFWLLLNTALFFSHGTGEPQSTPTNAYECIVPRKSYPHTQPRRDVCYSELLDVDDAAFTSSFISSRLLLLGRHPWRELPDCVEKSTHTSVHPPPPLRKLMGSSRYCGSCWAFGTTSAISDRIKIMRRNQFPEINLAPQVLINCNGGGTCQGGHVDGVYRYLHLKGLPDETCQNYQARNQHCSPSAICKNCKLNIGMSNSGCSAVKDFYRFKISDFDSTDAGAIRMYHSIHSSKTENIMQEIYKHGPVSCTLFATDKFDEYSGGIYAEQGIRWTTNHIVSLVGWGEEKGQMYWIARNSWGTYWGENGFFRIVRGDGRRNLGIENSCTWATPVIPKHLLPHNPLPSDQPWGEYLLKFHEPRHFAFDSNYRRMAGRGGGRRRPTRSDVAKSSRSYDIRNRNGISYASVNRNQNNPLSCESSWAQAATSALNDRFALLKNASHPEVVLSAQVLLNCVGKKRDACRGGDVAAAYAYIQKHGLPDESCSPYEAHAKECSDIHTCKTCWPDRCYALRPGEYTQYTISAHGVVSGDSAVMHEISENGPVACSLCDSDGFISYKGGIYSDDHACKDGGRSKKFVVLSGWGEKDGRRYWIGRNSWGSYWGESGWFNVAMGKGDMGITKECHWARPIVPKYRHLYSRNVISGIKRIKRDFIRNKNEGSASTLGVPVA